MGVLSQRATASETVHSVVILSRHGDRTAKNSGPIKLTTLGQNQVYASGEFYRARYLDSNSTHRINGISGSKYVSKELFASSPDQPLLVQSNQVFLQALYPPQASTETLTNGTSIGPPGNGQQYPILHSVPAGTPDAIWLKGDDGCPRHDEGLTKFANSAQRKDLVVSTKSFYESFSDLLMGVLPADTISYANAYTIFDYLNVGSIHNSTIAKRVTAEDLRKLRILADSREWALNGNITAAAPNPISISGSTFAQTILDQMSPVAIFPRAEYPKLSVLFGSYDTFLSFFALSQLPSVSGDFYGLPEYASTIAFELVSHSSSDTDMFVRFLFRNGTDPVAPLTEFPLFGHGRQNALMPFNEFSRSMQSIAIKDLEEWCNTCASTEDICQQMHTPTNVDGVEPMKMKPELAGGIGALCALAVVGILFALLILLGFRFGRKATKAKSIASIEKGLDVKA